MARNLDTGSEILIVIAINGVVFLCRPTQPRSFRDGERRLYLFADFGIVRNGLPRLCRKRRQRRRLQLFLRHFSSRNIRRGDVLRCFRFFNSCAKTKNVRQAVQALFHAQRRVARSSFFACTYFGKGLTNFRKRFAADIASAKFLRQFFLFGDPEDVTSSFRFSSCADMSVAHRTHAAPGRRTNSCISSL